MTEIAIEPGAGRYAPSPSGDLHLGNLRTALVAWCAARASGRRFMLRIEDLDRDRDAGTAPRQLADLERLGLVWDGVPMLQSQRAEAYTAALEQLAAAGLVYACTCSRKDILAAPTAPHAPPGAYPGTCRNRSLAERERAAAEIAPRQAALRLRVPDGAPSPQFTDVLLGETGGGIDDVVLRRGDGTIAYNLAVVVDDAAQGVDQIVRGADLASSTPRQILLQRLLGVPSAPEVEYLHVPLVLGENGARLAKRDGAVTLRELEAAGVDSATVLSWLGASLGLAAAGERVTADLLARRWDPALVSREPWRLNAAPLPRALH